MPKKVEPGRKIEIKLKTNPYSRVAILAVDQKVSFLKTGNDIDLQRLKNAIGSFDFDVTSNKSNPKDFYTALDRSNAFLLTDAEYRSTSCQRKRRNADSNLEASEKTQNKVLETLIFKTVDVGATGEFRFFQYIPESFTSYVITAFSMNSESGLGLAEPQVFKVYKEFFVELVAPETLFVGEVLKVKAIVYLFSERSNSNVKVTLNVNDKFELVAQTTIEKSCSFEDSKAFTQDKSKNLNDIATEVNFFIRAVKEGTFNLDVEAILGGHRAVAKKTITAKVLRFETNKSKGKFFDQRNRNFNGFYFDMQPESDAIDGTISTETSVSADILGPAMENTDQLL